MNEAVRSVHKVSCTALKELLTSHLPPQLVQPVPCSAHSPGQESGHLMSSNPKPSLLDELFDLLEAQTPLRQSHALATALV